MTTALVSIKKIYYDTDGLQQFLNDVPELGASDKVQINEALLCYSGLMLTDMPREFTECYHKPL